MHHWYHNGYLTCSLYFRDRDDKNEHVLLYGPTTNISVFSNQCKLLVYEQNQTGQREELRRTCCNISMTADIHSYMTHMTWLQSYAQFVRTPQKGQGKLYFTRQYSFNNQHFNFYRLMHCMVLIPFFHRILPIIGGLERSRVRASQLTSLLQD